MRPSGQSLVEFSLVFPLFILILMGLIEGGRFVYTDSTLSQAAREAARVGAVEAGWVGIPLSTSGCVATVGAIGAGNPGAHVCPPTVASMKTDIVTAANTMVAGLGSITAANVYLSCNTGQPGDLPPTGAWTEASGGNGCVDGSGNSISTQGDVISVRLTFTFTPITPAFSAIGFTSSRSASASMVIN
jgi:hypothetical protein